MTTPSPSDLQGGLSLEVIIPVIIGLLTALGVSLRLLYKGTIKRIDTVEESFCKRTDEVLENSQALAEASDEKMEEKFQRVHELVVKLESRVGKYFDSHERLRDKWDDFLREYLKIDSTRGQKVDALFRLNDQMQKILDALPHHVDSKIEEAFTHSLSELKLYIRELVAEEKGHVK